MKKEYYFINCIQLIFLLIIIVSCNNKKNEIIEIEVENIYSKDMTELNKILNIESYDKIDFSKEFIVKDKAYKIRKQSFHIFIFENEKCFDEEEWHEVMILFGGGVIIFGENITIFSETYHNFAATKYQLNIINENNDLIMNNEIKAKNVEIGIINEIIIIQFFNSGNEKIKYLFEIEDI
jgi:hypothetical protein